MELIEKHIGLHDECNQFRGYVVEKHNGYVPVICPCHTDKRFNPCIIALDVNELSWRPGTDFKDEDGNGWHVPAFALGGGSWRRERPKLKKTKLKLSFTERAFFGQVASRFNRTNKSYMNFIESLMNKNIDSEEAAALIEQADNIAEEFNYLSASDMYNRILGANNRTESDNHRG